jgi:GGDEF domain-containing protein
VRSGSPLLRDARLSALHPDVHEAAARYVRDGHPAVGVFGAVKALAERIRSHIETLLVDLDGVKLPATVSIGVSSFPEDSDDCRDLINKADQAMYNSKIRGRNCISAYSDLEASSYSQFQS